MIGNIYINGVIGEECTLLDVISQVKKYPEATSFKVTINSVGGVVNDGFDIYNYLRSLKVPIETYGIGMVASIATVVFMAGDTRIIAPNTEFMIHLPFVQGASGRASDIETLAEELRIIEKQLFDFYKKHLNTTEEAIAPLLINETWLNAEQLLTLGFTTAAPVQAVAKAYLNIKKNEVTMTNEDKSWIGSLFNKIETALKKVLPVNKLVQDATGTEINFPDLADGDTVTVGATATVNDMPAEGEYTLPDGTVYSFSGGVLEEIMAPATDELQQANATIAEQNTRIAELESQLQASNEKRSEAENSIKELKQEMLAIKGQIQSRFNDDGRKPAPTQQNEPTASQYSNFVNKAKNRK